MGAPRRRGRPRRPLGAGCVACSEVDVLLSTVGAAELSARFGLAPGSLRRHLERHGHPRAWEVPWSA